MRGLYEVYLVDPEDDKVLDCVKVVAKSTETARFKAMRKLSWFNKNIDDCDVIAHKLGDVRAKKEVQEVRVVTNVANRGTFSAATAGGGQSNVASGDTSIIAGGIDNTAKAWRGTHG